MKKPVLKGDMGLLIAAVGGAVLGDIIPTPGDALAFYMQRRLRDKWTKGEISAKKFWGHEALYYYTFNSVWWILVGVATFYTPGDARKKLRTLLALTGAGVVFSVLYKNISQDETENLVEKNAIKQKMYENADNEDISKYRKEITT